MSAHLLAVILWGLAQLETPHGIPAEPGPAGETGAWQLTPKVRHDRTAELRAAGRKGPFTDREIAEAHVRWLERNLMAAGVDPSFFNIALAWNCGFDRTIRGRAPETSFHYATRLVNLTHGK